MFSRNNRNIWLDNGLREMLAIRNPAAANESVTHPHVQNEAVCEGDGHQLVAKALEQDGKA